MTRSWIARGAVAAAALSALSCGAGAVHAAVDKEGVAGLRPMLCDGAVKAP